MKNKCCSARFKPETGRKLGASLPPSTSAGVRCGVKYARRGGGLAHPPHRTRPGSRLAAGLPASIYQKERTRAHAYAPAYYNNVCAKDTDKKSLKANPVQNAPERG